MLVDMVFVLGIAASLTAALAHIVKMFGSTEQLAREGQE